MTFAISLTGLQLNPQASVCVLSKWLERPFRLPAITHQFDSPQVTEVKTPWPVLRPHPSRVTVATRHLRQISDIHRVFEWNSFFVTDQWCSTLQLSLHTVASIAVLRDHLAI